jgi:nuclease S1
MRRSLEFHMNYRKIIGLGIVAGLSANHLLAWSAEGHRAVAIIAQQTLQQSGQFAAVQPLLGSLSLEDLATCPDEVREIERDHKFQMSPACQSVFPDPPKGTETWHFINIPVTIKAPTHDDVTAACPHQCVLTQIDAFGKILADTTQPAAVRLQALSFVVHFIGDVHQPLHDAVRGKDAGGNAEIIRINRTKTNLHHAWDDPLVSAIDADPQALATDLAADIQAAQAEPASQPEDWALQAFQFALADAYKGIPVASGNQVVATLSPAYLKAANPVVRQQIARAGVRLAQFISANVPTPPSTASNQ